jgi:hypothetical protein
MKTIFKVGFMMKTIFKVGDIVTGNELADARYQITRSDITMEVISTFSNGMMYVEVLDGSRKGIQYEVEQNHFNLVAKPDL